MSPRTPLLRPDRYFATREFDCLRVMAVLGLLVFAGPATLYGIGWILAANIDGTVMVDNPDRPPDFVCDNGFDSQMYEEGACDRPAEVERNVDTVLWSALQELVGPAFLAFPLAFLVTGVLLHTGAWLVEGGDGVVPTFGVAAWGMLPSLVGVLVMLPLMAVWLDPITVLPGQNPGAGLDPIVSQLEGLRRVTPIVTVVTAVWGGLIWRYGLEHYRGLDAGAARLVAGLTALIVVVAGLVS